MVLFGLCWSYWVHYILSTSVLFGLHWSYLVHSTLVLFGSHLSYSVHSVNLSPIQLTLVLFHPLWSSGTDPGFQAGGVEDKGKKNSNTLPYSINKLSTKTDTQKSLFLNILRYNHLPTNSKRYTNIFYNLYKLYSLSLSYLYNNKESHKLKSHKAKKPKKRGKIQFTITIHQHQFITHQ